MFRIGEHPGNPKILQILIQTIALCIPRDLGVLCVENRLC